MDKKDEKLSIDEAMSLIGAESPKDDTFFFLMMLLLLEVAFPSPSVKLESDVAELRGKVSVIENIVTRK